MFLEVAWVSRVICVHGVDRTRIEWIERICADLREGWGDWVTGRLGDCETWETRRADSWQLAVLSCCAGG